MRRLYAIAFVSVVLLLALTALSCGEKESGEGKEAAPSTTTSTTSTAAAKGEITAKQAMELLAPKAKEWAPDALPVNLGAVPRGKAVEEGRCNYWSALFYSPSKQEAYVFNYYQDQYMSQPEVSQAGRPMFRDAQWQVGDLEGSWKLDSPEAARIAVERGIKEVENMSLSLRQYRSDVNPPQAVPSSCEVYWEIEGMDGKTVYIDAATGEVLD
ncbi:MAG: hypothetical protein ACUVRX_00760 [Actinomycetota bacterium]